MIGIAVGLMTGRRELVAAIVGAGVGVVVALLSSPSVGIIAGGLVGPAAGLLVPAAAAHETAPLGTPISAEHYAMPGTHLERDEPFEPTDDGAAMSGDLVVLAVLMFLVTYPSRAVGLLTPGIERLPKLALDYLQLVGPGRADRHRGGRRAGPRQRRRQADRSTSAWRRSRSPPRSRSVAWRKNLLVGLVVAVVIVAGARALGLGGPPRLAAVPRSGGAALRSAAPRPRSRRAGSDRAVRRRSTRVATGPDRAEQRAVDGQDRGGVGGVGDVHPGPHDVGQGEARLGERPLDDREDGRAPAPRRRRDAATCHRGRRRRCR